MLTLTMLTSEKEAITGSIYSFMFNIRTVIRNVASEMKKIFTQRQPDFSDFYSFFIFR